MQQKEGVLMSLTVRDILEIDGLNEIEVIAGHLGLVKYVESVSVMDTIDISKWLKGKEILLVCGVIKNKPDICNTIVKDLAKKNISAIGCKFNTCFKHIPIEMLKQAEEYKIPLLNIPQRFSWTDIMIPIYNAIIENKTKILQEHNFLCDLLCGNMQQKEQIIKKMRFFNLEFSLEYLVVVCNIKRTLLLNEDISYETNLKDIFNDIESDIDNVFLNTIYFRNCNCHVSLIPVTERKKVINSIKYKYANIIDKYFHKNLGLLFFIGISSNYKVENIYKGYNEANIAIKLGLEIENASFIADFTQLWLYRLLLATENSNEIQESLVNTIKPLIIYDNENNTKYLSTLETYLEHGTKKAAEILFIHTNTLRYRLNKIEQIINKSLSNYDDKLELQICLKILKINNSNFAVKKI